MIYLDIFFQDKERHLCKQKSAASTQILYVCVGKLSVKWTFVSLHQSFCLWPLQALISVGDGTGAAPTCACLVPTVRPAPVPPASCSRETAGHATTPPRRTCSSPTASVYAESPWTPMTTPTCTYRCLSCTTSSHWTTTAWTENFTTPMSPWMS